MLKNEQATADTAERWYRFHSGRHLRGVGDPERYIRVIDESGEDYLSPIIFVP